MGFFSAFLETGLATLGVVVFFTLISLTCLEVLMPFAVVLLTLVEELFLTLISFTLDFDALETFAVVDLVSLDFTSRVGFVLLGSDEVSLDFTSGALKRRSEKIERMHKYNHVPFVSYCVL